MGKFGRDSAVKRAIVMVFAACGLLVATSHASALPIGAQVDGDIDGKAFFEGSGFSVAISVDGKRVVIGAPGSTGNKGLVRVYDLIGGTWTQIGSDIFGEASQDRFGHSVGISDDGTRIVVGAPKNSGSASEAGHVRVYDLIGGTWTQIGSDIDGEAINDNSGSAVAISDDGTRVAIGAPFNSSSKGQVRVYNLVGSTWTQVGADIDGTSGGDRLGSSVALSGTGGRLATGAPDGNYLRVFDLVSGAWTQVGADTNGSSGGDKFGSSVAISDDGTRVAVGAPGRSTEKGQVSVYDLVSSTWTKVGADIDGEANNDKSGSTVAMSDDGTRIAIAAPLNDSRYGNAGHVRIYDLISGTWTQVGTDIDGEGGGDQSGFSLAMSGDGVRIAIGAPNNAGFGSGAGHVRVFGPPTAPAPPSISQVTAGNGSLAVVFLDGLDGGSPIVNYKYSIDGINYIALSPASTSSPLTISGLTNGTTYSVTIKAVNAIGDSVASNARSGTPAAPSSGIDWSCSTCSSGSTPGSGSAPSSPAASTLTTKAPATTSKPKTSTTVKETDLPSTGSDSSSVVVFGGVLVAAGLILVTRRRRTS